MHILTIYNYHKVRVFFTNLHLYVRMDEFPSKAAMSTSYSEANLSLTDDPTSGFQHFGDSL